MEISTTMSLVTIIVTWLLGIFAKKVKLFNNKMIPMILMIEYTKTND